MEFNLQETPFKKIDNIHFKLEYKNPTGSVKDRGVSYQVNEAFSRGHKKFVISSSGNAAISACFWTKRLKSELTVFVSGTISKGKLEKLRNENVKIIISKKPVSEAIKFAKNTNSYNLRASTDLNGYIGYKTLAAQINKETGKTGSVFIPASSGTLTYGVTLGFNEIGILPQIHCVQSTSCNFIASQFDTDFKPTKSSIVDALVARTSVLKDKITGLIRDSNGFGWVVDDVEVKKAWTYLKDHNIVTSYEGAAALAAVWKSRQKNFKLKEPIVCILTGKYYG